VEAPKPPVPSGKKPSIPRDRTHGLIRGAKAHFEKTRQIEEWDYLKPYKKLLVDVVTSSEGLDRALSLANDLFNALESMGHRVVMAPTQESMRRVNVDTPAVDYWHHTRYWSPYRPTIVYVGSIAIGLIILNIRRTPRFGTSTASMCAIPSSWNDGIPAIPIAVGQPPESFRRDAFGSSPILRITA
jgi:hypothetical protein